MVEDLYKVRHKPRFSSLHRKWLASLSLLLLSLGVAFGALNYWYLKAQVKAQYAQSQASWTAELKGLIKHSVDRLQRLSIVIASLGNLSDRLKSHDGTIRSTELERKFSSVRYELDVERIVIFDKQGAIRWNWAPDSSSAVSMQSMMDAIAHAKQSEQPGAVLDCQLQCELNVVMPLLADGEHVGFIGMSQRITDLVMEFSTATGVDIGILVPASIERMEQVFPGWGLYTAALTHASALRPFIEDLSERYPSPEDIPPDVWLRWKDNFYVFHVVPLKHIISGARGYLVFISDVTEDTVALKTTNRNSLFLILGSLLLAEVFLFLLLRKPLQRLSHLAQTLPLVARGWYAQAYQAFNVLGRFPKKQDEIDLLYETSIDLTHQIEESQLALAADRDFIQGILDSVQVMILTQTRDGRLHMVNRYMSEMLGRPPEHLKKNLFVDLLEGNEGKEQYQNNQIHLFSSSLHRLEHEGSIIDASGELRHIIWIHTFLGSMYQDDAVVLSVGMDATDRIVAENRSRWLAHHDPLTGLANRLRFHEELERSFADAVRSGNSSALLLLDLDYFKTINDSSGHAAGDALLVILANELRARARKSDLIARLGGDEFAVLMPTTGQVGAETFAASLNERLKERKFQFGNKEYRISASIGIALLPQHGKDVEELMVNVDMAMYEAKKNGKGRWCLYFSDQESILNKNVVKAR
ncbi:MULTISPECIES: cache domain-containing protein [Methylomicrobium]|uniref:PAS domain S-box/diguanylate cyclase (GGDEF) domain-containing protein n=1 Tax=Methylomicrobium album BG8 TaxID=686340 RepID=H8GKJ7_METAL|nr:MULTISPECIES: cache domain-containing protein [Methylomicrobium]EIC28005.1 PAS domain S-box/diguanylate cyclase (GGDEF) domain-containing protein [Methylomicrobium album BG8]